MDIVDMEIQNQIRPFLDLAFPPVDCTQSVFLFLDYGYKVRTGPNRQNTLINHIYDANDPRHNPNSVVLSIVKPGDPLVGPDFKSVPNPDSRFNADGTLR